MASALYVYAIVSHSVTIPTGLTGLGGTSLAAVRHRDLAAVTSAFDTRDLRPAEQAVRHEETVETIRAVGPALPVRFGTVLPDVEAVTAALEDQYDTLIDDLHRLGDKVEFGVTVFWDRIEEGAEAAETPGQENDGPGGRYLRGRIQEYRREQAILARAEAIADDLDSVLAPLADDYRRSAIATPRPLLRAAYLLHPASAGPFQEAFAQTREAHPGLHLVLSGPWPPYTFVSRHGGSGGKSARPEPAGGRNGR